MPHLFQGLVMLHNADRPPHSVECDGTLFIVLRPIAEPRDHFILGLARRNAPTQFARRLPSQGTPSVGVDAKLDQLASRLPRLL